MKSLQKFDVAIIGSGIAGSCFKAILARNGLKVVKTIYQLVKYVQVFSSVKEDFWELMIIVKSCHYPMRLSMKAIVLTKYGSSRVLQLQQVAKPIPKD